MHSAMPRSSEASTSAPSGDDARIAAKLDRLMRAEQLMVEAKEAVDRAKTAGRNRVEKVNAVVGRAAPAPRVGKWLD